MCVAVSPLQASVDNDITRQLITEETKRILHKVDYGLGIFAILAHSTFLAWALNSILYPIWWREVDGNNVDLGWLFVLIVAFVIPPVLTASGLMALIHGCFGWYSDGIFTTFLIFLLLVWWNIFWVLFIVKADGNWAIFSTPDYIGNVVFFVIAVLIVLYQGAARFSVHTFWKKQVLFLAERAWPETDSPEERRTAVWNFVFALITISVTMSWYMTRFDGAGTTKPNWTNWLG
jgi:hypothetical protein